MKKNFYLLLLVFLFLTIKSPKLFAQYPAGSPVAGNGKLKVSGTHLVNECGNPVQLKGMSSHGVQWFEGCYNASSINALANDWKASVFRVAMYVQEQGYVTDPTKWKAFVDNMVDLCGQKGIYCLIDWHVLNPGDPNANIGDASEFWTYMASKHGSKKHVLYEICNEPNGVSWSTVKNYANTIVSKIRAVDPNTVIIIGTPNWSQDVDVAAADKVSGNNIMYTLHFYSGTHSQSLRDKANTAMSKGAAIFVTEFGTSQASGDGGPYLSEAENWMSWMNSNSISWCNWSFSDKAEVSAALTAGSCSASTWSSTTQSGSWVKGKMSQLGGNCSGSGGGGGTTVVVPTVSITSPANNTSYTAPASIVLNATASVSSGSVSSVEFYNGSTSLGSDNSSPYSFTWNNVPAGTYTITAKATSSSGGTATSSAITVVVKSNAAPTVSITDPQNNASYITPATIVINATAADANGTVSKVDFYNGSTLIGSDNSSPYSYTWTNVPEGKYTLTAKATDNEGAVTTSTAVIVTVTIPQAPYGNAPMPIPGRIESELYDKGGNNNAYYDTDSINSGGVFRTDGVDIEATTDAGGGYSIGWTAAGEWLEYSVVVASANNYDFSFRVASNVSGKSIHAEMDGHNVTGTVAVPNTGGYQVWQTVLVPNIPLSAGAQIMRIFFDTDGTNINYVDVTLPGVTGTTNPNTTHGFAGNLFPNPSHGTFTLNVNEPIMDLSVLNLYGEKVEQKGKIDQAQNLTFGSELDAGTYVLQVQYTSGKIEIYKIVKIK